MLNIIKNKDKGDNLYLSFCSETHKTFIFFLVILVHLKKFCVKGKETLKLFTPRVSWIHWHKTIPSYPVKIHFTRPESRFVNCAIIIIPKYSCIAYFCLPWTYMKNLPLDAKILTFTLYVIRNFIQMRNTHCLTLIYQMSLYIKKNMIPIYDLCT